MKELSELRGHELEGVRYAPPFTYVTVEKGHYIVLQIMLHRRAEQVLSISPQLTVKMTIERFSKTVYLLLM